MKTAWLHHVYAFMAVGFAVIGAVEVSDSMWRGVVAWVVAVVMAVTWWQLQQKHKEAV